jgi:hypothetical protein
MKDYKTVDRRGIPLTKEQAQDLVDYFGTMNEAARQLGFHKRTIRRWLKPENNQRRNRKRNEREKFKRQHDPQWRMKEIINRTRFYQKDKLRIARQRAEEAYGDEL